MCLRREWQKMRERNEALDCYVYARAAASAAGLDRFEERHWQELERQLGVAAQSVTEKTIAGQQTDQSRPAGIDQPKRRPRRVVRSRWLS